ncbi:MAG: protein kinase [Planctomycetes bacterium]|nr:protein kinase [Planctomycetota bacterium]
MERVGPYVLHEQLGRGAMGAVHRAVDARTGQEVALKVLATADERQRRRLVLEAKALARLRHRHIVALLDAGEDHGRPWIALELVRGRTLEERLDREGPLAPAEAARLVLALADALAHAHREGVLHRDLKPSNVLLPDGGGDPLLTDFGLASVALDPGQSRLTKSGTLLGSPGYWSPEQCAGDLARVGPATDVYGLGALLHAALTGRPPVEGVTFVELLAATGRQRPTPSGRDRALDALALRCLEKRPEDRPPSVEAVRRELARVEGEIEAASAAATRLARELERRAITAPVAGRVAHLEPLSAGRFVAAGALLLSLLPEGELVIVAHFEPGRAFGRLRSEQLARMRLDGFPWTRFGMLDARVRRVADEPSDRGVRVELALVDRAAFPAPLEHGLPGRVEVVVEEVSPAELLVRAAGGWLAP